MILSSQNANTADPPPRYNPHEINDMAVDLVQPHSMIEANSVTQQCHRPRGPRTEVGDMGEAVEGASRAHTSGLEEDNSGASQTLIN